MEVGLRFFEGLMGWDVRRAERDFIGWGFGVGGMMMFVVVFVVVVVFVPEWKMGGMEKEKGREGKGRKENGRGEERRGRRRRAEKGREGQTREQREKRRKESLHVYVRNGV